MHRRRSPVWGIVGAALLLAGGSSGQETSGPSVVSALAELALPVETFRLDNGLSVILSEDHGAPVVAVSVWYHVGSAHELDGHAGLAHLLEHLLQRRTRGLGEGELARVLQRAGGVHTASTDTDRTAFESVFPAGALDVALWIQADRMAGPVLSDSIVEAAKEAVAREGRARIDAQPYARSQIVVDTLASPYAPYRVPLLGRDGMKGVDASLVGRFHEIHYGPGNAVLAIVGDVTPERAREAVGRYFGSLDERPAPPRLPPFPVVPSGLSERRTTVPDPTATAPLLWVAYAVPEAVDEDLYALSLLSSVLTAGESSRLHRALVVRDRAAESVVSVLNRRRGPGTLVLGALPREDVGPEQMERLLLEEIERLLREGVTERELEKAKNQRRASEIAGRLTVAGRATELQRHRLYGGRAARSNSELARYDAVTVEDILRVGRRYLIAENRTVVLAVPGVLGG